MVESFQFRRIILSILISLGMHALVIIPLMKYGFFHNPAVIEIEIVQVTAPAGADSGGPAGLHVDSKKSIPVNPEIQSDRKPQHFPKTRESKKTETPSQPRKPLEIQKSQKTELPSILPIPQAVPMKSAQTKATRTETRMPEGSLPEPENTDRDSGQAAAAGSEQSAAGPDSGTKNNAGTVNTGSAAGHGAPGSGFGIGSQGGTGGDSLKAGYFAQVRAAIERRKQYPPAARSRRKEGKVVLKFTIGTDGSLSGLSVVKGSRFSSLDKAALAAIRAAAPFPIPPADHFTGPLELTVPMVFELTK